MSVEQIRTATAQPDHKPAPAAQWAPRSRAANAEGYWRFGGAGAVEKEFLWLRLALIDGCLPHDIYAQAILPDDDEFFVHDTAMTNLNVARAIRRSFDWASVVSVD